MGSEYFNHEMRKESMRRNFKKKRKLGKKIFAINTLYITNLNDQGPVVNKFRQFFPLSRVSAKGYMLNVHMKSVKILCFFPKNSYSGQLSVASYFLFFFFLNDAT